MTVSHNLTGISIATIDENDHVHLELSVSVGDAVRCNCNYTGLSALMAGLGRLFFALENRLYEKRVVQIAAAEKIASIQVQREQWEDLVILQLNTPHGVPYRFGISPDLAKEIADRMSSEVAKTHLSGKA